MFSKYCKSSSCWWDYRYEILGILLLIIATTLTIIAWNSLGIVAMFAVSLVLIGHKHFCYIGCHSQCHTKEDACDEGKCSTGTNADKHCHDKDVKKKEA